MERQGKFISFFLKKKTLSHLYTLNIQASLGIYYVETHRYGAPKRQQWKKHISPFSNVRVGLGNRAYFCKETLAQNG